MCRIMMNIAKCEFRKNKKFANFSPHVFLPILFGVWSTIILNGSQIVKSPELDHHKICEKILELGQLAGYPLHGHNYFSRTPLAI